MSMVLRSGRARRTPGGEEFQLRVRLVVAGAQRCPGAIADALACQEVGGAGPARNVHDLVLVLGEQVEPPRQVVTDVALLL